MPKLIKTPFAAEAAAGYRTDIQETTGEAPNSATYQVGFPPNTMQSITAGGIPPKGADMNGILYDITDNIVFQTQGGRYGFDSAYATSVGGYPLNAVLQLNDGTEVISTIANNTNDPNSNMTGWKYSVIGQEFKLTEVANSVKRSIKDIIYDQIIDVTWFGAKGNWNTTTQNGADDTTAVQNAINYYATVGTRRTAGKRAIRFPYGNYKITELTAPDTLGFGIDFIGDGRNSTNIWFDHNNTNPALNCLIEFVNFNDLSLFGSLSDQNGSNSSLWKQVGFKGKLSNNYPDINVSFNNCGLFFFQDLTQIYGRGCVFNNCILGFILSAMNIVADPATVFTSGSTFTSQETGMRHYTFNNCRFDVVSKIVKITGAGAQKDYINDIQINNCDFTQCDILIDGVDATIRRSVIFGGVSLYSFASGIVQVKSSSNCQMIGGNWSKEYNDLNLPDSVSDCINSLWKTTGAINGLIISGVTAKNILSTVASAGAASSNVKVIGCNFPEAWTFPNGSSAHLAFFSPFSCDGLQFIGNSFGTSTINGTYSFYDASIQNSRRTRVVGNTANWNWQDSRLRYTPQLLVNGVASATVPGSVTGRYWLDDSFVYVDVTIAINPAETTGDLALSLPPVSAVVENSGVSSAYGGNGIIPRYAGFTSSAGFSISSIVVNPSNQQAEIWKVKDMVQSRVTAADRTGSITLFATFKYRY